MNEYSYYTGLNYKSQGRYRCSPIAHNIHTFTMLLLVDAFRTLNWVQIKRDIEFSKISDMFPVMVLQNS